MSDYKRVDYIDALKVLASTMVVYNHTYDRAFCKYATATDVFQFAKYVAPAMLSKCAVPLFLMCTGAVSLGKQESLRDTYRKIPKYIIDLILFTVAYNLVDIAFGKGNDIYYLISSITGDYSRVHIVYWHLWYLLLHICLLLLLPLLRKLLENEDIPVMPLTAISSALCVGAAVVKPLYCVNYLLVYPTLGYLLSKHKLNRTVKVCLTVFSVVGMFVQYAFTQNHVGDHNEFILKCFCNGFAVVLFSVFSEHYDSISGKIKCIIGKLSKDTYGLYLIHILLMWQTPYTIHYRCDNVFVWCSATITLGLLITHLLRKTRLGKFIL